MCGQRDFPISVKVLLTKYRTISEEGQSVQFNTMWGTGYAVACLNPRKETTKTERTGDTSVGCQPCRGGGNKLCYVRSNQIGDNTEWCKQSGSPIPVLSVLCSCSADGSFQLGIKIKLDHDDRFSLCACVYMQSFILREVLWPRSIAYTIRWQVCGFAGKGVHQWFSTLSPERSEILL